MSGHLSNLLLGLGSGAVIAALAVGVVVTHRASNVINFAHAAIGTYLALVYYEFRATGDVVQPFLIPFVPERFHLLARPTVASAFIIVMLLAALVGALCYLLIFRPLRLAPPLARIVASLGLMTYLIGVMALRFSTLSSATLNIDGPLPTNIVEIAGVRNIADRYWLTVIVVLASLAVWALYRFSNFGLSTRASAESETGAVLVGISADRIGVVNWMLATMLAGAAMILAAPITRIEPTTTPLLIVAALGAALLGQFRSIGVSAAAGFGIGMLQSELLHAQSEWDWLPAIGLQQGVPFALVVLALMLRGDRRIRRGDLTSNITLPTAPEPRHAIRITLLVVVTCGAAVFLLGSHWRLGIMLSAIAAVITLSVIVLTGFVGQISLATFALAGIAAFGMVRAQDELGLGFPVAPLLGVLVAVAVGTIAGLPAIRIRGLTLAIASLAAAVAVEELVFKWRWFTGGLGGSPVEPAQLAGVDFNIQAIGSGYPRAWFGVLTLAILAGSMWLVVNLRRSATGRQWLAVRANERAAEAIGISAVRVKLSANAVAAFLAGVGGTLLAYQQQFVSAASFGALDSLVVVAIAYLSGIATPIAALVAGALTEGGLLTVTLDQFNDDASSYQFALNGLFLIVVAVKFPSGITGARPLRTRGVSKGMRKNMVVGT